MIELAFFIRSPNGTLPWQPISGKNRRTTFICRIGILKRIEYRNADIELNSTSDRCTSYNLVNFDLSCRDYESRL